MDRATGQESLRQSLERNGGTHVIIGSDHKAEAKIVMSHWPDDKVREYAEHWVARASARLDLADAALNEIRRLHRVIEEMNVASETLATQFQEYMASHPDSIDHEPFDIISGDRF